ncbi:MAG: hypothetical protein GYB67_06905 [Chloroflexi bacterium]|nr:hypothetical protein [Chloroflexota bacterium]
MTKLDDVYRIDNFNDTFALGHYARVLDAHDQRTETSVAFKVLRPEHLVNGDDGVPRWEYRAFAHEANLLHKLAASPHVVRLLDCGYLSAQAEAPADGEVESFGQDITRFGSELNEYAQRGWRPYLTLENLPRTSNLFYLMRPGRPDLRLRLPTEEGLALALQFAELLRMAHHQGIVYLDHKLEHVYWDGINLRVIDLNSSRLLDGPRKPDDPMFRTDIHNLCVGILYSVFTGLSPRKTTLRPQPGSLQDVEARYKDITALDFGIEPTLSPGLQALLQRGASMEIESAGSFIEGLQEVAARHGWDFPDEYTNPVSRDARGHLRTGLARLREGQDCLREARDLFREAAIQDGIPEDLEGELRRLVKAVNEMLNNRVIP